MQCTNPFVIKNPHWGEREGEKMGFKVPCGHCRACRIARSREWAVRLLHESSSWDNTCFLTLTYDPQHLPENNSLVPSDLQKFWKRLRKDLGSKFKIKYFACGEYGDNFNRPHYHAIVFGLSVKSKKLFESNWNLGFVKVGTVTYNSCRYVAGYVQKKLYGKDANYYKDNGLVPPYSVCSKGIGLDYVEEHWNQLYDMETVTVRGVPMGLPRYYKKKLGFDGYILHSDDSDDAFVELTLKRNKDFVFKLDSLVESGKMSIEEARNELCILVNDSFSDAMKNKDLILEAKEKKFKRSKL